MRWKEFHRIIKFATQGDTRFVRMSSRLSRLCNVQKLPIPGLIRDVSNTKPRPDAELTALRKTRGDFQPSSRG